MEQPAVVSEGHRSKGGGGLSSGRGNLKPSRGLLTELIPRSLRGDSRQSWYQRLVATSEVSFSLRPFKPPSLYGRVDVLENEMEHKGTCGSLELSWRRATRPGGFTRNGKGRWLRAAIRSTLTCFYLYPLTFISINSAPVWLGCEHTCTVRHLNDQMGFSSPSYFGSC